MNMHLDPECCDLRVELDGSLSVVAREGHRVVAGYSCDGFYDHLPIAVRAKLELDKWIAWERRAR